MTNCWRCSKRPIKCCQPGLCFAADPRVRDDTAVSGERTDMDRASDHIKLWNLDMEEKKKKRADPSR